jgi:hypothetical protein
MTFDKQRLEALKQGLAPAGDNGFVSIAAKDLRWLIELVESSQESHTPFAVLDQVEGEGEETE